MKPHSIHLVVLTSLLILLGCQNSEIASQGDRAQSRSSSVEEQEFVDDLQRHVLIPQPVRRIVSLAPSCTETLFAVGAGDAVVGVTTFSNYPPKAKSITQVGGLTRETVSIEKILELRPDVVFAAGTLQYDLILDLTEMGLAVVAFEPQDIDGIVANLHLAGAITGNLERAAEVATELERDIEKIAERVRDLRDEDRPPVFYEVWHRPLRTASSSSYLGQLIRLAGGRNIFDDFSDAYPLVSEEAVVQRNPHIILGPKTAMSDLDEFLRRPGWQSTTAIRNRQVHFLDEDLVSRPGPRVALGLLAIAQALHPDRFPDDAQPNSPTPSGEESASSDELQIKGETDR
jgi:iron complex transport system substrate-binding protein